MSQARETGANVTSKPIAMRAGRQPSRRIRLTSGADLVAASLQPTSGPRVYQLSLTYTIVEVGDCWTGCGPTARPRLNQVALAPTETRLMQPLIRSLFLVR